MKIMNKDNKWSESELLRLAATACGFKWCWEIDRERYKLGVIGLCIPGISSLWNPIEDSDNALDLAAKLTLNIRYLDGIVSVSRGVEKPEWLSHELYRGRERAATRLAIVKAAAILCDEKNQKRRKEINKNIENDI